MSRDVAVGPTADIETCTAAANTLDGWPARNGQYVGVGGIQTPMPDNWDGTGEQPPGWSDNRAGTVVLNGEAECPWPVAVKMDELIQSLPPGEPRGELAAAYARLRKETRDD